MPICLTPTFCKRSIPPLHNSKSGLIGFFISTGISTPRNASATSCTLNGFTVVRAPIHNTSTSNCNASCTCFAVATSTAVASPVAFLALNNQGNPFVPMPSNMPGFVRGFQMPARSISIFPVAASLVAVASICSSVSALHGPLIIKGRLFHFSCTSSLVVCVCVCILFLLIIICLSNSQNSFQILLLLHHALLLSSSPAYDKIFLPCCLVVCSAKLFLLSDQNTNRASAYATFYQFLFFQHPG